MWMCIYQHHGSPPWVYLLIIGDIPLLGYAGIRGSIKRQFNLFVEDTGDLVDSAVNVFVYHQRHCKCVQNQWKFQDPEMEVLT